MATPLSIGRLLDVGCGTGDLLYEFTLKANELWGIDIAADMISATNRRLQSIGIDVSRMHLIHGDIESATLPRNYFDLIICMGVLEHIEDKELFIKDIFKLLSPGGYIYIASPINLSPIAFTSKVYNMAFGWWWRKYIKHSESSYLHVKRIHPRKLLNHIKSAGGIIIFDRTTNFELFPIKFNIFPSQMAVLLKDIFEKFGTGAVPILKWLNCVYIIYARKPEEPDEPNHEET